MFHPRYHLLLRLRLCALPDRSLKERKKNYENNILKAINLNACSFFPNIPFCPLPLCVKFKPVKISFAMMKGFRYLSLNIIGQNGADFHSGTIRVHFTFSFRTSLIVSQTKFGRGTNQLFSEDQSNLKAFIPLVPLHQNIELNLSHFLL